MGHFWAVPRRLRRCTEDKHPSNAPTANVRLPFCRIVGSGGKRQVEVVLRD